MGFWVVVSDIYMFNLYLIWIIPLTNIVQTSCIHQPELGALNFQQSVPEKFDTITENIENCTELVPILNASGLLSEELQVSLLFFTLSTPWPCLGTPFLAPICRESLLEGEKLCFVGAPDDMSGHSRMSLQSSTPMGQVRLGPHVSIIVPWCKTDRIQERHLHGLRVKPPVFGFRRVDACPYWCVGWFSTSPSWNTWIAWDLGLSYSNIIVI